MDKPKKTCPFDKNHLFNSEAELKAHIKKCKSPNKTNFEQCKFNPDHWVNFSQINQHQKQCSQQPYSSSVDLDDDSTIEYFVNAIQPENRINQHHSTLQEEFEKIRQEESREEMKNKKKNKKQPEMELKEKFWVEPSFKKWISENPNMVLPEHL